MSAIVPRQPWAHEFWAATKKYQYIGTVYKVKADIRKIESFSGHADYKEMIQFLGCQEKSGHGKDLHCSW